jgi:mannose-6-phosphate isomerase-like protein (cupin superfamily)
LRLSSAESSAATPVAKSHIMPSTNSQEFPLMNEVNLAEKLATFSEHWQPRTVGQFNGHDLMVVKVRGEFVWHKHDDTDDFFLVLKGRVTIQMRDRNVTLGPGEMFVVPKGVEHCPVAEEEAHILLIEPSGTPNTGDPTTAAARRVI